MDPLFLDQAMCSDNQDWEEDTMMQLVCEIIAGDNLHTI